MIPPGISVHAARILSSGLEEDAIARMVDASDRAVDEVAAGDMSVIAYACLATSLVKGPDWSAEFEHQVEDRTGRVAVTAANAVIEALRSRRIAKVALATPYPDRLNRLAKPFFECAGIDIVSLENITVQNSLEVCRLPPSAAYRLARKADQDNANAVCILATDFRTIDVLDALERDLGKPVFSTNQALFWRALGLAGVQTGVSGFGSLLSAPHPVSSAN